MLANQKSLVKIKFPGLVSVVIAMNSCNALGRLVYTNGFTTTPGAEWSLRSAAVTPVGVRRFLGPFTTGTNLLTLNNLPSRVPWSLMEFMSRASAVGERRR